MGGSRAAVNLGVTLPLRSDSFVEIECAGRELRLGGRGPLR
jgi:hypothetical protein